MSELLLGLGRQRSVSKVLALGEKHIAETLGAPLEISAKSAILDFVATREDYDEEFKTIALTVHDSEASLESLEKMDGELGKLFDHSEEDGRHVYTFPREGDAGANGAVQAIDLFSKNLALPEVWHFEGTGFRRELISVELIFKAMVQYKASDTHLMPGQPPVFRIDNNLRVSELMGKLSPDQVNTLIRDMASDEAWKTFQDDGQCTFSFHEAGIGFSRASAFLKSGAPHLTIRFLPEKIPSFKELGLDEEMMLALSNLKDGLLVIAGMPGGGKTTTCAAVIDWINSNRPSHIVCIEDPIEYVHSNKKAFISQRELGSDVKTVGEGVEAAANQDADVLYIGEVTDVKTIRAAMNAASTGTLVITTMYSSNASGLINRIIGYFDPVERDMARAQLRENLACILCQKLVPRAKGGRVPAVEVLFNDVKPISNHILDGNTQALRIGMQQSLSKSRLYELYLHDLFKQGIITLEVAREQAPEISMFEQINMGTYKVPRVEA